jgi:hypothetical protein
LSLPLLAASVAIGWWIECRGELGGVGSAREKKEKMLIYLASCMISEKEMPSGTVYVASAERSKIKKRSLLKTAQQKSSPCCKIYQKLSILLLFIHRTSAAHKPEH